MSTTTIKLSKEEFEIKLRKMVREQLLKRQTESKKVLKEATKTLNDFPQLRKLMFNRLRGSGANTLNVGLALDLIEKVWEVAASKKLNKMKVQRIERILLQSTGIEEPVEGGEEELV